jgi:DNA-directed RNA polymerase subunit omega
MIMPIEKLIEYNGNSYEFTVAVSKRAYHLAVLKGPEVEKLNGKVVSIATRHVLGEVVRYRLES